jgi:hypothetical protein
MILRGGFVNFRTAVRHAARYSAACEAAHPRRQLTFAEYQEATGLSRSQCYRELHAWHACCGYVNVLEAVAGAPLQQKGWNKDEREDAIARWFSRPTAAIKIQPATGGPKGSGASHYPDLLGQFVDAARLMSSCVVWPTPT